MPPDNTQQQIDYLRSELERVRIALDEGRAVPAGGDDEQILAKASDDDGDTEWIDQPSGGSELPVGSLYLNADVATNPGTLLGYGTWAAFGAGRVLVGLDSSDTDFDTAEETGGHKETEQHNHDITDPGHAHRASGFATAGGSGSDNYQLHNTTSSHDLSKTDRPVSTEETDITIDDYGTGDSGNLQPYIVVYMWKRTA